MWGWAAFFAFCLGADGLDAVNQHPDKPVGYIELGFCLVLIVVAFIAWLVNPDD